MSSLRQRLTRRDQTLRGFVTRFFFCLAFVATVYILSQVWKAL